MISHRTSLLHACKYCDKKFNIRQHLSNHEKMHEGHKPFNCKQCDRRFINQDSLNRHSLVHSNAEYICDLCQKKYRHKLTLRKHIHEHIIDPNFMCAMCGATFGTEFLLRIHARSVHKKPLNKVISADAKKHLTNANNDSDIMFCKICKINFETNKDLLAHVKVICYIIIICIIDLFFAFSFLR